MVICRLSLFRSCSSLQISSLSHNALRQNCPRQFVTTQYGHREMKLSHASNCVSTHHVNRCSQVMTNNVHRAAFFQEPITLSAGILDSFLLQSQLSQNSGASQNIQKYICPSRLNHANVNIVILDNITSITSFYDCPVSTVIDNIRAPSKKKSEVLEGPGKVAPKMEAKIIMRIRHKKMKKHKLRKLRKRMYFLWSRQNKARKAKRMKLYRAELEKIKATGNNFDPMKFVQEQIEKAKKGGFGINILDSKTGQ